MRVLLLATLAANPLAAQAPLRGSLPDSCLLAVEVPDGARAYAAIAQAIGGVPRDLPEELRAALGLGLLALPQLLGGQPEELAHLLAGGGAALGLVPVAGKPVPLLVLRPADMAAAVACCERLPNGLLHRQHGELLWLSPSAAGLDLLQAQAEAAPGRFAAWRTDAVDAAGDAVASACVDLAALRALLPGRGQHFGRDLDGGGRFLVGGLASVLQRADRLVAVLHGGASLQLCARADAGVDAIFAELMPAQGQPRSLPNVPPETVLTLALDRSLQQLLHAPQRYLTAEQVTQTRAFLSVADQIDGYTSFVDDLLGGMVEPWTLLVLAPHADAEVAPPLQLPGFAVIAGVKDRKVEAILLRMAQAFVLIADGERAKRYQPPFRTRALRGDDCRGLIAELPAWRGPGAPPLDQALSPTLAFGAGHVVVASTEAAARSVLAAIDGKAEPRVAGDHLDLRGQTLAASLQRAFGPLVLARMLDEGEGRAAAERFWRAAIAICDAIASVQLDVAPAADATTLRLEVRRR